MVIERLIKNHLSYLKGLALFYTKNDGAADDLMQDTILRIWCNRDKFAEGTNFKAWASTVMRNLFINGYRRQNVRKTRMASQEYISLTLRNREILNDGDLKMEYEDIVEVVNQLKDNYRRPINLLQNGYSYQEIAETLDISLGTVKSRIHTARHQLKKRLHHEQPNLKQV